MAEKYFTVSGMSCGHCAASVTEEVVAVPGVTEVDVDVRAGLVTVRGEAVDDAAVRAAVVEAGYEVAEVVRHAAA
ncbi:heavy-metal-associated domain-containing protein [Streptomyces europaeiscabiei]|uniref:Heavy-metal-associated domain-containing protein n=1 Tax=Streptomyces europaeiscabiei TaxID=146819 RepID=A0ABU4NA88_9ACTN|nr:heavy-metal-associated domain-containing protein [Streptomyces europaeiscabiei]MDX2523234.1 heavy-metal-associated domain-containing protein [Streptomyces europaeiscabiei]MDX2762822.1 heavy-metal-associated domain-containing protein [Streptomyces europaeiscabiei]MDX2772076.1 heavy-metal-associated domain-containing protein [Streptomyces europaeiscabiei]MDX3542467.1 heavy-metal-associated domain-containing protein [Streptomyces europaeiscabiei]MDX3550333.1 heavy-metal-associated domain-conta